MPVREGGRRGGSSQQNRWSGGRKIGFSFSERAKRYIKKNGPVSFSVPGTFAIGIVYGSCRQWACFGRPSFVWICH